MLDRGMVDHQHDPSDQEQLLIQHDCLRWPVPRGARRSLLAQCRGALERARERVVVQPHAQPSTNTYFGRFPASYWQRWTAVTRVEVGAVVQVPGRISVRASDSVGDVRTVAIVTVEGAVDDTTLSIVDTIYVVDQGNDTVESRAGFAEIQRAFGGELPYRRQPNLGGADGFTRALTFLLIDRDGKSGRSKQKTADPSAVRAAG